jgi:hypothetical protein
VSRVCTICQSDHAAEINLALTEHATSRQLAKRFPDLSRAAIDRHARNCVPVAVHFAQAAAIAQPVLLQLRDLHRRTLRILQAAEAADDGQLALNAVAQARKNLELEARLTGELTPNAGSDGTTLQVAVVYQDVAKRVAERPAAIVDAVPMLPESDPE